MVMSELRAPWGGTSYTPGHHPPKPAEAARPSAVLAGRPSQTCWKARGFGRKSLRGAKLAAQPLHYSRQGPLMTHSTPPSIRETLTEIHATLLSPHALRDKEILDAYHMDDFLPQKTQKKTSTFKEFELGTNTDTFTTSQDKAATSATERMTCSKGSARRGMAWSS
ncbi:hypothetical protein E2C01_075690 [Portunus trituberculatus]|uniref:Uncharacterized protein n=1 Tax=Portunus trituberculatus TaxID=210409 RepID=A0A5B7I991_PORTR|nr:hypothetical protein [Portunus trituberculatus]